MNTNYDTVAGAIKVPDGVTEAQLRDDWNDLRGCMRSAAGTSKYAILKDWVRALERVIFERQSQPTYTGVPGEEWDALKDKINGLTVRLGQVATGRDMWSPATATSDLISVLGGLEMLSDATAALRRAIQFELNGE